MKSGHQEPRFELKRIEVNAAATIDETPHVSPEAAL
jgi:hypothetical protein